MNWMALLRCKEPIEINNIILLLFHLIYLLLFIIILVGIINLGCTSDIALICYKYILIWFKYKLHKILIPALYTHIIHLHILICPQYPLKYLYIMDPNIPIKLQLNWLHLQLMGHIWPFLDENLTKSCHLQRMKKKQ